MAARLRADLLAGVDVVFRNLDVEPVPRAARQNAIQRPLSRSLPAGTRGWLMECPTVPAAWKVGMARDGYRWTLSYRDAIDIVASCVFAHRRRRHLYTIYEYSSLPLLP